MSRTVVFIHGMFLNGKSWEHWVDYFASEGYHCVAPSWPLHAGDPAELRARPPHGLGQLELAQVVESYAREIRALSEKPILIGHSVGGLIVQILVARGLASMGVCISSVAPNDMISLDWGLLKNTTAIVNPLKGHEPYEMTPDGFHATFANMMSEEGSWAAYDRYALHESRQVMRDGLGKLGHIDLDQPHVPLLFIGGENDAIIPPELNRKNAERYRDPNSIIHFHEFPGRGHFICGQPGWEEVASYVHDWLLAPAADSPVHAGARIHHYRDEHA